MAETIKHIKIELNTEGDENNAVDFLDLVFYVGNRRYLLNRIPEELDDSNYEEFITKLIELINEAYTIKNILKLNVIVDDDVPNYILGREEDIAKEIKELLYEL